jgi:hypothetical protein
VCCVGVSREEGGQEGGARGGGDVFRPLRLILLSASTGGVEEISGLFNTLFVSSDGGSSMQEYGRCLSGCLGSSVS